MYKEKEQRRGLIGCHKPGGQSYSQIYIPPLVVLKNVNLVSKDTVTDRNEEITQDKDVHYDTGDGRPHQEPKCCVDVEVWCKCSTNPEHGLHRQAHQDHHPAAVSVQTYQSVEEKNSTNWTRNSTRTTDHDPNKGQGSRLVINKDLTRRRTRTRTRAGTRDFGSCQELGSGWNKGVNIDRDQEKKQEICKDNINVPTPGLDRGIWTRIWFRTGSRGMTSFSDQ